MHQMFVAYGGYIFSGLDKSIGIITTTSLFNLDTRIQGDLGWRIRYKWSLRNWSRGFMRAKGYLKYSIWLWSPRYSLKYHSLPETLPGFHNLSWSYSISPRQLEPKILIWGIAHCQEKWLQLVPWVAYELAPLFMITLDSVSWGNPAGSNLRFWLQREIF